MISTFHIGFIYMFHCVSYQSASLQEYNLYIYIYKTEMSARMSVCLSVTFGGRVGDWGCRGRWGGWTGIKGTMGRGDVYDGMPGWT